MPGDEDSELATAPPVGPHAADVAVARRIACGDEASWESFLAAIRPVITRTAIEWCHRISPGRLCRHCAVGVECECATFSSAEATMEGQIRKGVMAAYDGQTALALFTESLVYSNWWFSDFAEPRVARLGPPDREATAEGRRVDLVQAWAILAGSSTAWGAFLNAYNGYVERAAISWCHRAIPSRVCRKCKPGVDHDCDAFGEAYLYILKRLRSKALAAYRGGNSLRSFVFLCLHDHRWWLSFVQKETGKVKLPKALKNEAEVLQQVYVRVAWGWDDDRIAAGLKVSSEEVAQYRARVELKLRDAGRTLPSRRLETVSLSGISSGDADDDGPRVAEPSSATVSPEVRAEAIRFWEKLSVQDRTILRLRAADNAPVEGIAAVLGITASQVYGAIYRIRREMPEWFKL